uniref:Uncharacterized protein n=1 Tax=Panagrolaimus sp. ES5 TaxID=591445 RepID=A0AC34GW38_9BILA
MSDNLTKEQLQDFQNAVAFMQQGLKMLRHFYDRNTIVSLIDNPPDNELPLPTNDFALLSATTAEDKTSATEIEDALSSAKSNEPSWTKQMRTQRLSTDSENELQQQTDSDDNSDSTSAFLEPETPTNDPKAKMNYESEIYDPNPANENPTFPCNHKLLNDPNTVITTLECNPFEVLFKLSNGFESTTVSSQQAYEFIQFYSAATTVTFKSTCIKPVMYPDYMHAAIKIMTQRFWSSCEKVTFRGLWHHQVLVSIAESFGQDIKSIIFRRCAVAGPFRLQRIIHTNMKNLDYINFDCRVSDTKDFAANVRFLRDVFPGNQFSKIFLNVTAFPRDVRHLKDQENASLVQ